MAPRLRLVLILCCAILGVLCSVQENTLHRVRHLTQSVDSRASSIDHFSNTFQVERKASHLPKRLLQSVVESCEWNQMENTCTVSTDAIMALLEKADNPVSRYIHKTFKCVQLTESKCVENGCQWYGVICAFTFKDYQNFISSPCLKNAKHLVNVVAWQLECAKIENDFQCNAADHCYWSDTFDCVFDKWTYFFNIETINGMPEGFSTMFDARSDEVTKHFNEVYNASNADETLNEILYTPLPKFRCEYGGEQILCSYVEATSQVLPTTYYCLAKYASNEDLCRLDAFCDVGVVDGQTVCGPSKRELLKAVYAGEQVFGMAIKDPPSKEMTLKQLHCLMRKTEHECTGDCIWEEDQSCSLSGRWTQNLIHQLIGHSNDPVCQYLDLSKTTGCIDRDSEIKCDDDDKCLWSDSSKYCLAGVEYNVDMALEASHMAYEYEDLQMACQDCDTDAKCSSVSDYDSRQSMHHYRKGARKRPHPSNKATEPAHRSSSRAIVQGDKAKTGSKSKGPSIALVVSTVIGVLAVIGVLFVGCYWGGLTKYILRKPEAKGYREIGLEGIDR